MADLAGEYEKVKSGLRAQAGVAKQAAQRRIAQKFGNRLGSGAIGKLGLESEQNIDFATEQQVGALDLEQQKAAREERLMKQGQEFQRGERIGSQEFAGTQAELGRKFQTGERLGSQEFAGGQAELGRRFQTSERIGSQEFASGERRGAQEFQAGQSKLDRALTERGVSLAERQFDEQVRQYNKEWEENLKTNLFNKIVALKTSELDPEELNKLAASLGYERSPGKAGMKGYSSGRGFAQFGKDIGLPSNTEYDKFISW